MRRAAITLLLAATSAPALAQDTIESLRAEVTAQREQLQRQDERLRALEARLQSVSAANGSGVVPSPGLRTGQAPVETVGAAPSDFDQMPQVAVLGDQGNVITRAGQLTGELTAEYARADRNRAIFRGIELVESVLVGVFDINESRQDILTAALGLRYGITDRFEVGVRLPYVYRNDASILAPIAGSTGNDAAATIDNSARGDGIGDVEVSARYQLTRAQAGRPFLIANLQAVFPTGSNPFNVPRDDTGRALEAATGAGFYGISPSLTGILQTDPAVLFGTVGYNFNLARNVDARIPPVQIDRVDPADAVFASAGIGVSLNQRTSINLGYAHTWGFGTRTWVRSEDAQGVLGPQVTTTSRDLQIGRFLFGVTYRVNDRASLNWAVEVGATEDAADLRTVIRVPIILLGGR
ncbi:transporter [Sphingomonas sp.]|jgi:hypothetical protein|uniref:transporter n=1 Tax=Sphingomonas sp. TaxID=28214 RepID=UPI002DF16B7D|nr:transporter [Sphingomonas sp.]